MYAGRKSRQHCVGACVCVSFLDAAVANVLLLHGRPVPVLRRQVEDKYEELAGNSSLEESGKKAFFISSLTIEELEIKVFFFLDFDD